MSLSATRWAWQTSNLDPPAKLVLLALADRANNQGKAWPSMTTIQKNTGLDQRTVRKAIMRLQQRKLIIDTGERTGKTARVVVYQMPFQKEPGNGGKNAHINGGKNAPIRTEKSEENHMTRPVETKEAAKSEIGNRYKFVPRTIRIINIHNARAREEVDPSLPEWLPQDSWDDWIEHRKTIGHPVSDSAQRAVIRMIDRLRQDGHDPGEMIDHSIIHGWRGIFPTKKSPATGGISSGAAQTNTQDKKDDQANKRNYTKLSAAERARDAEQRYYSRLDAEARETNNQAMDTHGRDIRAQMDEQLRTGDDGSRENVRCHKDMDERHLRLVR